jgi:uncharacterized protein
MQAMCVWPGGEMEQFDDHVAGEGATVLFNDTVVNVAQLLKEHVGASRRVVLRLDWFALDQDIMARDVEAAAKLTRINDGILVSGSAHGMALVECVRCLEMYDQPFDEEFDQEYRPTIDVRSGIAVAQPGREEELGSIDELHQLDLAEPIRQVAIVSLPIKPICRDECPGLPEQAELANGEGDARFSELERLLAEEAAPDDQ